MSWVKVDDKLHESDKLGSVSDAAFRLWVLALSWSNDKLTDGHVPSSRPMRLMALRNPKKTTAELVEARLWHLASRPCKSCLAIRVEKKVTDQIPSGGWVIHDYFIYQKARWVIVAEREQRVEAGRRGGRSRGKGSDSLSEPLPDDGEQNGDDGSEALSEMPSKPLSKPLSEPLEQNGLPAKRGAKRGAQPPYPRTPVPPFPEFEKNEGTRATGPDDQEPPIPDAPEATDRKRSGATTRTGGLHHISTGLKGVKRGA
jgi:hypothetical protein